MNKISSMLDSSIMELDRVSRQVYYNYDIQASIKRAKSSDIYKDIPAKVPYMVNNHINYYDYANNSDRTIVQSILSTYNLFFSFNTRIIVFDDIPNYISSSIYPLNPTEFVKQLEAPIWKKRIAESPDKAVILPPHKDWWSDNSDYKVVSFLRQLVDILNPSKRGLGYIEVQLPYSEIEKICSVENQPNFKVLVINSNEDIVYPIDKYSYSEISYYRGLKDKSGLISMRPSDNMKELVFSKQSDYTNWQIILTQSEKSFKAPLYFFRNLLLLAGIILVSVSLVIMYIVTTSLTSPIREMRRVLETLPFENPTIPLNNKTNNEIVMFNEVFNNTLSRLKESMEQTIEAKMSESKAHFLALQAQMNPHFIYNTLMVISSAGYEMGSRKIVMICSQLSDMMRYIVSLDSMKITLREELEHTKNYLQLLKWRFGDQFFYEIAVDERLYDIQVPKLIIQPLTENSYIHGFSSKRPPWNLSVKGWLEEDMWLMEIADDGIGMSETKLEKIKNKILESNKQLKLGKELSELDIGGMGLSNIYYRLFIIYRETLVFGINTNPVGGITLKIGGSLQIYK